MKPTVHMIVGLFVCVLSVFPAFGQEHWPQFRGPGARGVGKGQPPIRWDLATGENILWKTTIPGLGHSSPIIWGDRVFLTTATSSDDKGAKVVKGWSGGSGDPAADKGDWQWKVLCLDRSTGKILWSKEVAQGKPEIKRHLKATHANCTPATDGKHVLAFFGSEGLFCLDFQGNVLWKKNFGRLHSGPYNMKKLEWGFASSPVIFKDQVIIQCDCLNTGFIAVLNIADGKEVRRIPRKDVATWSSPCVFQHNGKTYLVCNGYKQMACYDYETGKEIWTLSGGGDVPVPTPLFDGKRILLTNGHARSPVYAISPTATGTLTPKKDDPKLPDGLLWYNRRGGSYMPTPIIIGNLFYNCNDRGVLSVLDMETGEQVYRQRVGKGRKTYTASGIGTKDHLYFFNEDGLCNVVKTGREYESVAVNQLKEIVMATPAICDDQLFVRTIGGLVCISKKKPSGAEKPTKSSEKENSKEENALKETESKKTGK